jgi:spore coat polysaccharide biosynthesis predicted glycosyltransferase SpsG
MNERVVFRVDASQKFGTGHVSRTRYLADQFQANGYTVDWVATPETFRIIPALQDQYRCFSISEDLNQAQQIDQYFKAQPNGRYPSYFVQDGFHMDGQTIDAVQMRYLETKTILIEDKANRFMGAPDYLIDPSFNPLSAYVKDVVSCDTHILLGPQYQMLDPAFQRIKLERRRVREKGEIVLMNGGGNIGNLLGALVNVFAGNPNDFNGYRFTAYALSSSKDCGLLQSQVNAAQVKGLDIDLRLDQKPDFTNTALYVGAAGTACYELGAVGGVASILIGAGNNQDAIGQQLASNGAAIYAGRYLSLDMSGAFNFCAMDFKQKITDPAIGLLSDKNRLMAMARQSQKFCDGLGAERVYHEITRQIPSRAHA